ncbi:MAG: hypothetical protein QOJ81_1099, partial [Chloroflexota bacterium]|nr:hypothetical protein [Chloroflexota bacterium]
MALADDPPLAPAAVTINSGNGWTNNPIVSVGLPYPTHDDSLIRLSNNGTNWGPPVDWAPVVNWDLLDPATGGADTDDVKAVYVQSDNGTGSWADVGNDSINLDRLAPQMSGLSVLCDSYQSGWIASRPCWGNPSDGFWDYTNNIDRIEFSLDGGPWTNISEATYYFDFRTPFWGGNWEDQDRHVCVRALDRAGNQGAPECSSYNLNIPAVIHRTDGDVYDIRIDMPLPAVTGQPFTLRPVLPDNFPTATLPSTAICDWMLTWGDMDPVTHAIVV